MKRWLKGLYDVPNFAKRFIMCLLAVIVMGFCVSWLDFIKLGTDPCSVMNLAAAAKLGLSFGNWQILFNSVLFIFIFIKDKQKIGFGTLLNMTVVGYSCDFMNWVRKSIAPELAVNALWARILVMLVLISIFVVAASVYIAVDLGTAPYDALPIIIADMVPGISAKVIRIIWDCTFIVIGFLLGGTVGIVTILMAFTLGPVIAKMREILGRHIVV